MMASTIACPPPWVMKTPVKVVAPIRMVITMVTVLAVA